MTDSALALAGLCIGFLRLQATVRVRQQDAADGFTMLAMLAIVVWMFFECPWYVPLAALVSFWIVSGILVASRPGWPWHTLRIGYSIATIAIAVKLWLLN